MRRSITSYLSSAATFAKANDEGAEAITKMVYLKGDDTIKQVVYRAEAAALSCLEFIAAMTLHCAARMYNPLKDERASNLNEVKAEILQAIKEHAQHKGRKEFGRAWTFRLLGCAVNMGRSLMTDYDKKGLVAGSPLETILRSKSADKAVETIVEYMTAKTKGQNSVDALEKALAPAKAKARAATGKAKAGAKKGQASNNQRPVTTAATAKAIMGAHAEEVFQAVPAKSAKDRANKLADKVGAANNVDHAAFILRSLTFVNDADKLMAIAEKATELAKAIQALANENADTGKPEKAVAAQG